MATVVLCRHGESTWNRQGRVQGWAPTTLTDRGRRQARALGAHLADEYAVDRLLASDLQRAQETARAVGRATGREPAFRPAWRERDFGRLQGLRSGDLFERFPQYSLAATGAAAAAERPESGESLLDARERLLAAWRALRSDLDPEETAAVVTHGGPIHLLAGHVNGESLPAAMLDAEHDNASVTEIRIADGAATVVRENELGFLDRR